MSFAGWFIPCLAKGVRQGDHRGSWVLGHWLIRCRGWASVEGGVLSVAGDTSSLPWPPTPILFCQQLCFLGFPEQMQQKHPLLLRFPMGAATLPGIPSSRICFR